MNAANSNKKKHKFHLFRFQVVKILKVVGQNIRLLRESQGYTQETLAIKAGIQRSYIGNLEHGDRNVTLTTLNKIAIALNVNPIILLIPKTMQFDE
jgi:transcriptional regulator with XRE-family HTH domain